MSERFALCLGPHRSGTSLLAAMMAGAGVDFALPFQETSPENPRGFYEHPAIRAANDRLLHAAQSAWDDPCYDPQLMDDKEGKAALDRLIRGRGKGEYGGQGPKPAILGAKDPRMARMLQIWRPLLSGYDLRLILATRDPVAAALSHQRRVLADPVFYDFGRHLAEGAALWLSYTRQMLCDAEQGLLLDYNRVLDNPKGAADRISAFLDLTGSGADQVAPDLDRARPTAAERAEVEAAFPGLTEAWQTLAASSGQVIETRALARLFTRDDWAAQCDLLAARAFGRHAANARRSRRALAQCRDNLDHARRTRAHFAAARDQACAEQARLRQERDRLAHRATRAEDRAAHVLARTKAVRDHARTDLRRARAEAAGLRLTLDQTVADESQTRAALARSRAALGKMTQEMAALRAEFDQMRASLEDQIATEAARAQTAEDRHRRAQDTLAGVLGSRSWRITAPLRYCAAKWRSVRALPAPDLPRTDPPAIPPQGRAKEKAQDGAQDAPLPLVSIIVPNYNHAAYLRQRLDSIYAQTYPRVEVILLDDASTDNSVAILQEYASRPETRLIVNTTNSGGVFHQWERGLRAAKGDLIWIAESDDLAQPDFLEKMVPLLADESVRLAFAKTTFIGPDGTPLRWQMEDYLAAFGRARWAQPWVMSAPDLVREVFAIANAIPNVGGALFRRPRLDAVEVEQWRHMRVCGDWMFYLNIMRGGYVAYCPEPLASYRIHPKATSQQWTGRRFFRIWMPIN